MATSTTPNSRKVEPSLPPLVVPICSAMPRARARAAGAGGGADAHVEGRRCAAREPGVARQEDAGDVAATRVDQRGLGLEQRQDEAAAGAQAQRPIAIDRVNAEPDLVHVCDDDDRSSPVALPRANPEAACGIGFGLG